jgi:uncharacterized membrane protein
MISNLCRLVLACGVAACATGVSAATPYAIHAFAIDGATNTTLVGINNSGTMVGYATFGDHAEAITVRAGHLERLMMPGALSTYAWDASDGGVVVGIQEGVDGLRRSFIFSGGVFADFSVPGAVETDLRGISPDGRFVTGFYVDPDIGGLHGFVHDRETGALVKSLGDISISIAQGINQHGQVAGSQMDFNSDFNVTAQYGFIHDLTSDVTQRYQFEGYTATHFRDITADGLIAGWLEDSTLLGPEGGVPPSVGFVGRPGDVWLLRGLDS